MGWEVSARQHCAWLGKLCLVLKRVIVCRVLMASDLFVLARIAAVVVLMLIVLSGRAVLGRALVQEPMCARQHASPGVMDL